MAQGVCAARSGTSETGRFGRSSSVVGASDVVVAKVNFVIPSCRTAKRRVCGRWGGGVAAEAFARRTMSLEKAILVLEGSGMVAYAPRRAIRSMAGAWVLEAAGAGPKSTMEAQLPCCGRKRSPVPGGAAVAR